MFWLSIITGLYDSSDLAKFIFRWGRLHEKFYENGGFLTELADATLNILIDYDNSVRFFEENRILNYIEPDDAWVTGSAGIHYFYSLVNCRSSGDNGGPY